MLAGPTLDRTFLRPFLTAVTDGHQNSDVYTGTDFFPNLSPGQIEILKKNPILVPEARLYLVEHGGPTAYIYAPPADLNFGDSALN